MVSVSGPGNTELRITEPETSVYRHAVISAARSRALPSPALPGPRRVSFHLAPFVHGTATAWSDCGGDVRRDVSESADVAVGS